MSAVSLVYVLVGIVVLAVAGVLWRLAAARRGLREAAKPPGAVAAPAAAPELKPAPAELPAAADTARPLLEGLARTRGGFIARIADLLGQKKLDAALLVEIEEVLLTADIGVKTAQKLCDHVRTRLSQAELSDANAVWTAIREESRALLDVAAPPLDLDRQKPFVILTIGVNGVGKTTTIGKLASRFRAAGKRVLLAAGDTFRAAATEQLQIWGQRVDAPVVAGKEGGDPSAVLFDAVKRAKTEDIDLVIADTAGRLHTKTNLMEELQKVRRVLQKADPLAPHETWLVLDATNGQNAIAQAQMFKQMMDITGIVLTKLDGTAKGGVILGIADELKVPVRFIGIGEKAADLRPFDPAEFVAALYNAGEAP